jgi:hypothetical protein
MMQGGTYAVYQFQLYDLPLAGTYSAYLVDSAGGKTINVHFQVG